MSEVQMDVRKKSPRAPSMSLDEGVERVQKIYAKENRHPVPIDIAAQHIGYKDGKNGAAMSTLATLGYYGLIDRPKDGFIAVSKDFETFQYAPSDSLKRDIAIRWLKTPAIFSDLLEKYGTGLPSDGTIKYDLIQRGFKPPSADSCVAAFRRSVEYARYFDTPALEEVPEVALEAADMASAPPVASPVFPTPQSPAPIPRTESSSSHVDRIPIRLSGGRRAWLEVPTPFYAADKQRIKAHVELLLADDDEQEVD